MARRPFPWKALAVGGGVLSAIGAAVLLGSKKKAAASGSSQRIALIGDSCAVGLGPELEKLLPDFK